MAEENICKLCGEKLKKKEGDALYYCLKCKDEKHINNRKLAN